MGSLDQSGVCLVQKFRNLKFTILGRKTKSPLVLPQFFTFENIDSKGRALNLEETVLLQEEINPLLTELSSHLSQPAQEEDEISFRFQRAIQLFRKLFVPFEAVIPFRTDFL
ncbi:DUF1259 domain-containing protein [Fictibacillus sp. NRS-1165]|uniref:DUF1259 domain-containing protein n=1 Tax=Fictibacillus sp. NRS-1165 TaxID=3144463 RepID=UPI003D1FAE4B